MINKEVWGNIELPGLSDEELFTKDWNKIAAQQETFKDPKRQETHKEMLKQRSNDPKWNKNVKQGYKKRLTDPKAVANHQKAIDQRATKTNWYENTVKKNQAMAKDPEYLRKHQEGMDKVKQTDEWKESVKQRGLKRRKTIQTPYGIFHGLTECAKQLGIHTCTVRYKMTHNPTEWHFIE